ncbi:scarecrow-like protein 21 [Andrographis paniculata]|uniref:scarecrow-like protein 21 n=1 Tax=Andrographis paniculata TaxID=175694 RepID=UPI0021E736F7|nr:scarecrow-like protein 21 [Andrographis paniculata]
MDSQYFGYSICGAELPYPSYSTVSSIPAKLFQPLTFSSRNSPNSPFSTQFDTETIPTYSDSLEQHSSSDNFSAVTPCNTSLDSNSYRKEGRPSPFCRQNSLPYHSTESPFQPNANNYQSIRHVLQELESTLMAPDEDDEVTTSSEPFLGGNKRPHPLGPRSRSWNQEAQISSPGSSRFGSSSSEVHLPRHQGSPEDFAVHGGAPPSNLKQLLMACAGALYEDKVYEFEKLVAQARTKVSISGEPIQRLGAYMLEGLIARKELSGTNIYRALKCNEPESKELLSYMHILYEICPYLKFGYMAANGAIAEACRHEDRIHIVDFQIGQGTQWMTLLQALAARPSGAPHVRITGIDDPVSQYARGDGLSAVGCRLAAISEKFNIPVEFHAVPVFAPDITRDLLDVRPGEALAVNFPLQLHHTPDESVDVTNPRDGLLRMVKSLSPKVVTLVEQESNTNTAPFLPRFKEALEFYSAMFESIDVTMPRERKERINVEQHCLARDIVNIVACEGRERVERHELLGKWRSRFLMAGFRQFALSSYVNSVIRQLLRCYSEHYTLVEKDGAMLLGWKDRNLVSASAWC